MACPYFLPVTRIDRGRGARVLPLGDAWSGSCQADPEQVFSPDESALIALCNLGYARKCPRFPREGAADAVRFSVARDRDGVVRIHYVIEKDYEPLEHGLLAYSRLTGSFLLRHDSRLVQRQAEAYMESYLVRTSSPSPCSPQKQ